MKLTSPQCRVLMEEVLDEDLKKILRNLALAAGLTIPMFLGYVGLQATPNQPVQAQQVEQGLDNLFQINMSADRPDGQWAVVTMNKDALSKVPSHKKAQMAQMYLNEKYPQFNWALQKTTEKGSHLGFAFLNVDSSPQSQEAIQSARQDMGY